MRPRRPALFTHRRLDFLPRHSFTPSIEEPLTCPQVGRRVTRHFSRNSFVCHRSKKSPANSFICHTSKNGLPQVLCLPHLRYPRGLCTLLFLPSPGRVRQPNGRQARLLVFGHESPVTTSQESRVTHRSHCAGYRAVPQLASYAKCCETNPLPSVSKEAERTAGPAKARRRTGQGFRQMPESQVVPGTSFCRCTACCARP